MWRVKGPVGPVTITQLAAAHSDGDGMAGDGMAGERRAGDHLLTPQ